MKSHGYREPTFKVSSYIRNGNFKTTIFLIDSNSTTNSPQDEYQRYNDIYASRETTNMHMISSGIHPQYTLNVTDKESLDLIGSLGAGDYYTEHFPKSDAPAPYNTRINRMGGMESNIDGKIVAKTTRLSRNQIALGGSAGFRRFDNGKSLFDGPDQDWGDQTATGHWKEMSLFAEDVVTPLDALTFSVGARYDRVGYGEVKSLNGLGGVSTVGADVIDTRVNGYVPFTYNPKSQGHISKRVAASYEITNKTVTRLSYQEGFRYPDMVSFYRLTEWNSILASGGQPMLQSPKPETMESTEYNLHHDFDKSFSMDGNLFYNVIKNQLVWIQYSDYLPGGISAGLPVPNGFPLSAINYVANTWPTPWAGHIGWMGATANISDRTTIRGGELIANWSPTKSSKVIASYSHAENATETSGTGSKIAGYPRHIIKVAGTDKLWSDNLELGFTYVFSSRDKHAANRSGHGRNIYSYDRHLVGINSRYYLLKNLDFQFMVQNLFGTDVPRYTPGTSNDPNNGSLGDNLRFYYAGLEWKI